MKSLEVYFRNYFSHFSDIDGKICEHILQMGLQIICEGFGETL